MAFALRWSTGLWSSAGSPPFSDGSIGLADALVNSIPFLDSFTTGQLEALQASADNLPDGYPQAFQAKTAIREALERKTAEDVPGAVSAPAADTVDETAAGRRLREIETEIAAMQPGPARDAALRDGIRNLTSQIERLDPEDEGDLLGLWGQIDTARDQAAALALFRDRPDLVTDGIRAAVVHRALELNGSPPFSDGSIGLADALVNSIPFLDSFTTGQLEALQASADNLPDGYPQAFQAKTAIREALEPRSDREPVVVQPIRSPVSEVNATAQAPAASPSVSEPPPAYSAETLSSRAGPPPAYTVEQEPLLENVMTIARRRVSAEQRDVELRQAILALGPRFEGLGSEQRRDLLIYGLAAIAGSDDWASAVEPIGRSLAAIEQNLRQTMLYPRLDQMLDAGQWAAATVIIHFAPSAASLPEEEQIGLLYRTARIRTEHVFLTAIQALRASWHGGVPAFEIALRNLQTPDGLALKFVGLTADELLAYLNTLDTSET